MAKPILETQENKDRYRFQGGMPCVSTFATLAWRRVKNFNASFTVVATGLKYAVPKSSLLPTRALKSHKSLPDSISRPSTSEPSSSNSMPVEWKPSNRKAIPADQQNFPRNSEASSLKPPCVHRTFWVGHLDVGRWRSFENTLARKVLSIRSVWRRFAAFCVKPRSNFGVPKRGKNAMIRDLRLKKTDSSICKESRTKWPNDRFRSVRALGDSTSAWSKLVPDKQAGSVACDLQPSTRYSTLVSLLRCALRPALGLFTQAETPSGSSWCLKAFALAISDARAYSSDPGQLLTAQEEKGTTVLPQQQYSPDLDSNECLMAKSYRKSLYAGEGICHSKFQLQKSQRTGFGFETLYAISKQTCS